jgi:hypothetical protein
MSRTKNIVIVAVLQVGVIVIGVLAAGLCRKVMALHDLPAPAPAIWLANFGVVMLLLPLAWAAGALVVHLRQGYSEDIRALVFWLGILLLIGLVAGVGYVDVSPWVGFLRAAGTGEADN